MALMIKDTIEKEYVQIPNTTAKAVEEKNNNSPISLEALGLLVNLWSYDVEKWDLHKTELYKRYAKNKKTSVTNAWDELVENRYIIEFKYRNGRKWEYVYIYRIKPYSEEEVENKLLQCVDLAGVSSTSDFQHLKFGSSKRTVENTQIIKTTPTKDKLNKDKLNKDEIKPFIDDDEKKLFKPNKMAFQYFVDQFENNFPDKFDNNWYNAIWVQMHIQKLSRFTYKEAVIQARYMQQRIAEGKLNLGDYAAYFVGGILRKRTSQKSALKQEEIEKAEKEYKEQKERETKQPTIPFYNWLED